MQQGGAYILIGLCVAGLIAYEAAPAAAGVRWRSLEVVQYGLTSFSRQLVLQNGTG